MGGAPPATPAAGGCSSFLGQWLVAPGEILPQPRAQATPPRSIYRMTPLCGKPMKPARIRIGKEGVALSPVARSPQNGRRPARPTVLRLVDCSLGALGATKV